MFHPLTRELGCLLGLAGAASAQTSQRAQGFDADPHSERRGAKVAARKQGASFDRFGIAVYEGGGQFSRTHLDDLEYTAAGDRNSGNFVRGSPKPGR
jgi:hypothetical protein